jgi:hypothetical protein
VRQRPAKPVRRLSTRLRSPQTGDLLSQCAREHVADHLDRRPCRYDMLCLEGISRALRVFLGKMKTPRFVTKTPENPFTITVSPAVSV